MRNQLIRAVKHATTANNVGSVEYGLSCARVLSKLFRFAGKTGATPSTLQCGRRMAG